MPFDFAINENYWENFQFTEEDLDYLNGYLLEIETPLSPEDLVIAQIAERIRKENRLAKKQRNADEKIYFPREIYNKGDKLTFPIQDWQPGKVIGVRGNNGLKDENFQVIAVEFEGGAKRELAMGLENHALNDPPDEMDKDPMVNAELVMEAYGDKLAEKLVANLVKNSEFVYIAGRWFPKALIIDVGTGSLNLAEAALDLAEGGPLKTMELLDDAGLPDGINPKLAEFSLDLALQEDERFDEVGPEGEVTWFLKRGEPSEVLQTPAYLRYKPTDYNRDVLTDEMLSLEKYVDDELSPVDFPSSNDEEVDVRLIFPHWRAGTLPLTSRIAKLFPTAYEAPRIRFMLVDGDTGDKFPGWVVRLERYVFGLGDWYRERGLMPGSYIHVRKGEHTGEVIIRSDSHRSSKEWVRTALVGSDGGVVYAVLKQIVSATFDERMMIYMPADINALESLWEEEKKKPFEEIVVETLRELAKLNPQSHVHITELYSAVNVRMRTPPGPIMSLLASHSWYSHVGDLHYKLEEGENE